MLFRSMKFCFFALVADFFILMYIGSQHVESPYIEIGQIATAFYFGWFVIILPLVGILENTLIDIALSEDNNTSNVTTKPIIN